MHLKKCLLENIVGCRARTSQSSEEMPEIISITLEQGLEAGRITIAIGNNEILVAAVAFSRGVLRRHEEAQNNALAEAPPMHSFVQNILQNRNDGHLRGTHR